MKQGKIRYIIIILLLLSYIVYLEFNVLKNYLAKQCQEPQEIIVEKVQTEYIHSFLKKNDEIAISVNKEMLLKDLNKNYSYLSTPIKLKILDAIFDESKKYNINPLIIYSLIHVESTYRFWLEHEVRVIDKDNQKITVRAVGLGGIVWEWYEKELKEQGIAQRRSDLFDPVINIKAIVMVYDILYKRSKMSGTTTQDESAMIRYFGGNHKWYFERINSKIMEILADNIYRN